MSECIMKGYKRFLTGSGYTVFMKEHISAFTLKHSPVGLDGITNLNIDVFMICGSIFTVNNKDVENFLDWIGDVNE